MPQEFSAIGLFCEDIREEKSGQDTLVGVMSQNLRVPRVPGMLAKLGIYIRVHLPRSSKIRTIKTRLKTPDGEEIPLTDFGDLISQAKDEAAKSSAAFGGLISKSSVSPFAVNKAGSIQAIVDIDGTEYVCGALNIVLPEAHAQPST
jgi:hypothetical protein